MSISLLIFLLLYFGGFVAAFIRHPIWGLMSYTLALYASPVFHWWGAGLPGLRWSLLSAIVTLTSIFLNKTRLEPKSPWTANGAAKLLIAYTVWLWVQLAWALSFDVHLEACILFTKYIILFYMIYMVVDNDKRFIIFLYFNIIGGLYWGKLIRDVTYSGRIEGLGGPGVTDSNTLGMQMVVLLIFAALMLLKKNSINLARYYWILLRLFTYLAAIIIANGVVQTISRSAVVGMVGAGMTLFIINHKGVRKKFLVYCMAAFTGLLILTPYTFWDRLATVKTAAEGGEIEASAASRIVIGKAQLEMLKENYLGNGHRGTAVLSPLYLDVRYLTSSTGGAGKEWDGARSSHCTFLTALVEQGIPGAIMYWLMVFWVMKAALGFGKDDESTYLYMMTVVASLTAIFISGIFVDYLKVEIQIYCFAMLAGLKDLKKRAAYAACIQAETPLEKE